MMEEAFAGSKIVCGKPFSRAGHVPRSALLRIGIYPGPILMLSLPTEQGGLSRTGAELCSALSLRSCCEPVHLPAGAPDRSHGPADRAARRQARL